MEWLGWGRVIGIVLCLPDPDLLLLSGFCDWRTLLSHVFTDLGRGRLWEGSEELNGGGRPGRESGEAVGGRAGLGETSPAVLA